MGTFSISYTCVTYIPAFLWHVYSVCSDSWKTPFIVRLTFQKYRVSIRVGNIHNRTRAFRSFCVKSESDEVLLFLWGKYDTNGLQYGRGMKADEKNSPGAMNSLHKCQHWQGFEVQNFIDAVFMCKAAFRKILVWSLFGAYAAIM